MKKSLIIMLGLFMIVETVSAVNVFIKSEQNTYEPGDTILIYAGMRNTSDIESSLTLDATMYEPETEEANRIAKWQGSVPAGEDAIATLFKIQVTDEFSSGRYRVVVRRIVNRIKENEQEISFNIVNTLKKLNVDIHLRSDADTSRSIAFLPGEPIEISYDTEIDDLQVEGTVFFQGEELENMILPAHIQMFEPGTYVLTVEARKDGYMKDSQQIHFAVLAENPEFEEIDVNNLRPENNDLQDVVKEFYDFHLAPEDTGDLHFSVHEEGHIEIAAKWEGIPEELTLKLEDPNGNIYAQSKGNSPLIIAFDTAERIADNNNLRVVLENPDSHIATGEIRISLELAGNKICARKNMSMYNGKQLFLVSDKNWRDVLQLVPVTIWQTSLGSHSQYPTIIYHEESGTSSGSDPEVDVDACIRFLQNYQPANVVSIGNIGSKLSKLLTAASPTGAGLTSSQIKVLPMSVNNMLAHWSHIDRIVICEDDYETGLMAAVVASLLNAPLVFDGYFDYSILDGRDAYVVGTIDNATDSQIKSRCTAQSYRSLPELKKNYVNFTKTNKVILVNPGDLNISHKVSGFLPEKGSKLKSLYSKHSLAAPFLAAAKNEVIISTKENTYLKVDQFVEQSFQALNIPSSPTPYLTIIANPLAIPMARENRDSKPAFHGNRIAFEELNPDNVQTAPLEMICIDSGTSKKQVVTYTMYNVNSPDIHKDKMVWADNRYGNWDIFLYDFVSKTKKQITTNCKDQKNPSIYGDVIVWEDNRDGDLDIYMYRISTGKESKITGHCISEITTLELLLKEFSYSKDQRNPDICGNYVVWEDNRNGSGNWDIYMYNINSGIETRVTTNSADQFEPCIDGDYIVWQDKRNGNWDIYMYDVAYQTETQITSNTNDQLHPSVSNGKIVWEDSRNNNWDVYMSELISQPHPFIYSVSTPVKINNNTNKNIRPIIDAGRIIWQSEAPKGIWHTYMYDTTSKTTKIVYDHLLTHDYTTFRQEVDGRYYGSTTNYGIQDRAAGRIFGITSTDVSAYVARSLFYNDLHKNNNDALVMVREDHQVETRKNSYNGIAVYGQTYGPVLRDYAEAYYWTASIRNQFTNKYFYAGTTQVTGSILAVDPNASQIRNNYAQSIFILYSNHGDNNGFGGIVTTTHLRKEKRSLLPSTILDIACGTNTAVWGYVAPTHLFSMENLRRGAMVYQGAVDVSYWHRMFKPTIEGVYLNNKTIGQAYLEARNLEYYRDMLKPIVIWQSQGDPYYSLLGDPTFIPKWW